MDEMKFTTKNDLQCTHCGHIKSKLDLYCFFAWQDGNWSDRREWAPQAAVPALVQYCPECKRFYHIYAEAVHMTDVKDYNWIEPVDYMAVVPSAREYDDFDWSPIAEYNQRMILMWAYNDTFYRGQGAQPSDFDKSVARWNLLNLTGFFEDPVMIAELLREAEMYEDCLKVISEAQVDDPDAMAVMARIKGLAESGDNKPFKL